MNAIRKITLKCYIISNLVIAAMFINVMLFGPRLAMGEAFTAGLATGLGTGWLVFAAAGWAELKRPGRAWDERMSAIHIKASAFSFWVMVLVVALLTAALRSEALSLSWTSVDVSGLLVNAALATYAVSAFAVSRKL